MGEGGGRKIEGGGGGEAPITQCGEIVPPQSLPLFQLENKKFPLPPPPAPTPPPTVSRQTTDRRDNKQPIKLLREENSVLWTTVVVSFHCFIYHVYGPPR